MTVWLSRFTHTLALLTLGLFGLMLFPGSGAAAGVDGACKPVRGLVVLVEFPGTSVPNKVDRAFVEDRFFV